MVAKTISRKRLFQSNGLYIHYDKMTNPQTSHGGMLRGCRGYVCSLPGRQLAHQRFRITLQAYRGKLFESLLFRPAGASSTSHYSSNPQEQALRVILCYSLDLQEQALRVTDAEPPRSHFQETAESCDVAWCARAAFLGDSFEGSQPEG